MRKKIGFGIGILFILFLVYNYNSVYSQSEIKKSTHIKLKTRAIVRALIVDDSWVSLFPKTEGPKTAQPINTFFLNNKTFTVINKTTNSISVKILSKDISLNSTLIILPLLPDSSEILWVTPIQFSKNPLKLLKQLKLKKEVGEDMTKILEILNSHYSKLKNVYGLDIHAELVVDSILVFHSSIVNSFPSPKFIYSELTNIENYISKNGAKITGNAMLNIQTDDSIKYLVKVAFPVDKKLIGNKDYAFRGMLARGKILQATIVGGYKNINKGFRAINNYLYDYNIVVPAIPFESLITNRDLEKDTSKWITKIYCPIM